MTKGYDNLPMLFQSVLDIPMYEAIGALAHDIARQQAFDHTMTLTHAPPWAAWPLSNLAILSFIPGHPDFMELSAANSADMNYQDSAFSLLAWVFEDSLAITRFVIERGLPVTDGWHFGITDTGQIYLITSQLGADQVSASAAASIVISTWYLIGATRLGNSVRIFKNGIDITAAAGNHINPAACGRKLHMGIDDTEGAAPWDGYIWRPRVFSRQLSAGEILDIFEMERDLFGV